MNRMIARAHGEWIISVQDFIEIPEGALDYIASLEPAFYTFPVGKISADSDEPRWDWRISKDGDIHWQEWEICFGAAPREWLIAIGGFDEQLDQAWGFDNVNVGFRAYEAGYPLKCDPTLRAIALDHDAFMPHPLKAQRDPALHNRRLDEFRRGQQVRDIFKYMVQS